MTEKANMAQKASFRLCELMKIKDISNKELSDMLNLSEESIKKYKTGDRMLGPEHACNIAKNYGVTLDWLYGVSSDMNPVDTMANIVSAMHKIFRIVSKKYIEEEIDGNYICEEMVLQIDKKFHDYLVDIAELQRLQSTPGYNRLFSEDDYTKKRLEIWKRHHDTIEAIFTTDTFDEKQAIEIKSGDLDTIQFVNLF